MSKWNTKWYRLVVHTHTYTYIVQAQVQLGKYILWVVSCVGVSQSWRSLFMAPRVTQAGSHGLCLSAGCGEYACTCSTFWGCFVSHPSSSTVAWDLLTEPLYLLSRWGIHIDLWLFFSQDFLFLPPGGELFRFMQYFGDIAHWLPFVLDSPSLLFTFYKRVFICLAVSSAGQTISGSFPYTQYGLAICKLFGSTC